MRGFEGVEQGQVEFRVRLPDEVFRNLEVLGARRDEHPRVSVLAPVVCDHAARERCRKLLDDELVMPAGAVAAQRAAVKAPSGQASHSEVSSEPEASLSSGGVEVCIEGAIAKLQEAMRALGVLSVNAVRGQ